jgi:VIT1/CCC1 family predicted Fe2+/Mn2+ transporter
MSKKIPAFFIRNFVFGVEDSLVSTLGLISGIAIAGVGKQIIFLTGIVLIFVEAFSMSVGGMLSDSSTQEYIAKRERSIRKSFPGGVIMFFSYFFSGFIPLFPYVFFETRIALSISIIISLITLFVLGAVSARLSHIATLRGGLRMMIVGGIALVLGVFIAILLR